MKAIRHFALVGLVGMLLMGGCKLMYWTHHADYDRTGDPKFWVLPKEVTLKPGEPMTLQAPLYIREGVSKGMAFSEKQQFELQGDLRPFRDVHDEPIRSNDFMGPLSLAAVLEDPGRYPQVNGIVHAGEVLVLRQIVDVVRYPHDRSIHYFVEVMTGEHAGNIYILGLYYIQHPLFGWDKVFRAGI